jgi:hypothetical protein
MDLTSSVRIAAAHQPNFLPRLKTMCKLATADIWIVLDDVQFVTREWQNRCWIHPVRHTNDRFRLTVPVHLKHGRSTAIHEVELVNTEEAIQHLLLSSLHAYRSSRYWKDVEDAVTSVADRFSHSLLETALGSADVALKYLPSHIDMRYASTITAPGPASSRLALLSSRSKATHYVAGPGSRAYMQLQEFRQRNVTVVWQDWQQDLVESELTEVPGIGDWNYLDYLARYGQRAFVTLLENVRHAYRERCVKNSR